MFFSKLCNVRRNKEYAFRETVLPYEFHVQDCSQDDDIRFIIWLVEEVLVIIIIFNLPHLQRNVFKRWWSGHPFSVVLSSIIAIQISRNEYRAKHLEKQENSNPAKIKWSRIGANPFTPSPLAERKGEMTTYMLHYIIFLQKEKHNIHMNARAFSWNWVLGKQPKNRTLRCKNYVWEHLHFCKTMCSMDKKIKK
mgnify:CR=1 FL=1